MKVMWDCPCCPVRVKVDTKHFPVHCACGHVQYNVTPGWGDHVAAWLANVGITKTRYNRWRAKLLLRPGCGCGKRQRRLNAFGAQLSSLAKWLWPI